jgi:alpha-glucosidase
VVDLMNLGLSGAPLAGAEGGGFPGVPTPELVVRWFQLAAWTPYFCASWPGRVPVSVAWSLGEEGEEAIRRCLELRYQLAPYLYCLLAECSRRGSPLLRPLLWHYPNDPVAVVCTDEFLLGANLLVAPVLREGAVARSVYLPRGRWFDFWSGQDFRGGGHFTVAPALGRTPLWVKAGSILPMERARPFLGGAGPATIFLHVWPGNDGRLEWYDDDGETTAYAQGAWERRDITASETRRGGWLHLGAREGDYRGPLSRWRVVLRSVRRDYRVRVNGKAVNSEFVPELGLLGFDVPAQDGEVQVRWT